MSVQSPEITLRIGTRASPLAMAQAEAVAADLARLSGGRVAGEPVKFTTKGDQLTTERLINAGGKGLFTRELDRAIDAGEIDVAVHSLKDVPSLLPDGQVFLAFPERADPREGFVCPTASSLTDLADGAVVGTASLRREAQTLARRPDVSVVTFRGNVQTRMRKLKEGEADATYLAMAGLTRLGMTHLAHPIAVDDMLPAAGQGIICAVALEGALPQVALDAFAAMNHFRTEQSARAERAFLTELDGSCRTPIAAHLFDEAGGGFRLKGEVLRPDGGQVWAAEDTVAGDVDLAALERLGAALGRRIREDAGGDLPAFDD